MAEEKLYFSTTFIIYLLANRSETTSSISSFDQSGWPLLCISINFQIYTGVLYVSLIFVKQSLF